MIKVLFFGRTCREEVAEYDFIINDILPENKNKKPLQILLDSL